MKKPRQRKANQIVHVLMVKRCLGQAAWRQEEWVVKDHEMWLGGGGAEGNAPPRRQSQTGFAPRVPSSG